MAGYQDIPIDYEVVAEIILERHPVSDIARVLENKDDRICGHVLLTVQLPRYFLHGMELETFLPYFTDQAMVNKRLNDIVSESIERTTMKKIDDKNPTTNTWYEALYDEERSKLRLFVDFYMRSSVGKDDMNRIPKGNKPNTIDDTI